MKISSRWLTTIIGLLTGAPGLLWTLNPAAAWELCYGEILPGGLHLLRFYGIILLCRALLLLAARSTSLRIAALASLTIELPAQLWAVSTISHYGDWSGLFHLTLLCCGLAAAMCTLQDHLQRETPEV
ncbi:MAG: hypothetical protein VYD19_07760 [Myxococcota bacterium]|nr:hypothetical protein [Myxococcota bacterium]